jgi:hypothetical protein
VWFGIREEIEVDEIRHVDPNTALVLRVVGNILLAASLPERRISFGARINSLGQVSGRLHVGEGVEPYPLAAFVTPSLGLNRRALSFVAQGRLAAPR